MPAPAMTPELERDLKLLRMRNYVDPKRFYKAADSKTAPKFFHVRAMCAPFQVSDILTFDSAR